MANKFELAMEVPTEYLDRVAGLIDWHFVIATECLKDAKYFNWYRKREPGVRIMLDNGMFEEGAPISSTKLYAIAQELQPDVVFAPDQVGDMKKTLAMTREFIDMSINDPWHIGFIPQGDSPEQVVECFEEFIAQGLFDLVNQTPVVGLSFLNDRREVVRLMQQKGYFQYPDIWYHMLGLYSLGEIQSWPSSIRTMDTVKPFKAAYYGYEIKDCPRGLGKWDTHMVFPIESRCLPLLYRNIAATHIALTKG